MKNINLIKPLMIVLVVISAIFIACSSDQTKEYNPELITFPPITFTGFSPTTGYPGTPITITGTNFGDVMQAAKISFNEADVDLYTEVVSYTDTEMVVLVPEYAGDGPIDLSVWTNTAQSPTSFTYLPGVEIKGLSSDEAVVGDQISIFGANFGTDANAITVLFNGVAATILTISDKVIEVEVPDSTSGLVTITYDEGNRETVGPPFIYINPSIVHDTFLVTSPEFGGCFDRSGTQEGGYWPTNQPINYIGDRVWEIHGNNQSGRKWGYVNEGSGELTIGATRSWGYNISSHAASGYTKPTMLTLEANFNLGTFVNNVPPRPYRGFHFGFIDEIKNSVSDGNGVSYGGLRGVIITPESNEIYLWDGSYSTDRENFNGLAAVPIPEPYDRYADHHLKLVVDTTTGKMVSFEFDGIPVEFTDSENNALSPNFSDVNTNYILIGGNAVAGGEAKCYDVSFY